MTTETAKTPLQFRIKQDCEEWELPLLRSGKIHIVRIKCSAPIQNGIRWHLEIGGELAEVKKALSLFSSGNAKIDPLPAKAYDKGDRVLFCSPPNYYCPGKERASPDRALGVSIEGRVIGRDLNCAQPHAIVDIGTATITAAPRFLVLLEKGSPEAIEPPLKPTIKWQREDTGTSIRELLILGEKTTGLMLFEPKFDWQRKELNAEEKPAILYKIAPEEYRRFFPSDHTPLAYFSSFKEAKTILTKTLEAMVNAIYSKSI